MTTTANCIRAGTDEPAWGGEDGERPVRTGDPVEQVLEQEAAS